MIEIVLLIILSFALGFFLWRWLSNVLALPCPSWLSFMVELDNPFAKAHKASTIIKAAKLEPHLTVLDAGSGPGRLTIPLAKALKEGRVVALDCQQAMLDKVKAKSAEITLTNIEYCLGRIGESDISEHSFDRIFLVAVLGELIDKTKGLSFLANQLNDNGFISITETVFDPHYISLSKLKKLTSRSGLTCIHKSGNRLAYTAHFAKTQREPLA